MANEEGLTDDYVAGLLAKDAKESSIKYSALGLEAFAGPSKPPVNKPKPNTRFLRNIIKETDSHNAALLAREAAESRARLQSLTGNGHREQRPGRLGGSDVRRRQLGDIAAILKGRPTKRKRTEDLEKPETTTRRVNTSSGDEDKPSRRELVDRNESRSIRKDVKSDRRSAHQKRHRGEHDESSTTDGGRKRRRSLSPYRVKGSERRIKRHKSRSRSPAEHRNPSKTERSPRRKRCRSESPGSDQESSHKSRTLRNSHVGEQQKRRNRSKESLPEAKADSDSDPLDEIIGPRPPSIPEVRSRGRGTISHASGIDSRFSAAYDPSIDVRLDPEEENDWDQALEALQDRMKWKQQGADRLRGAGFTEEEVAKWEKGGEKREEDVKWAKQGEGREWDRGKVLDDAGTVTIDPKFGRLKDT